MGILTRMNFCKRLQHNLLSVYLSEKKKPLEQPLWRKMKHTFHVQCAVSVRFVLFKITKQVVSVLCLRVTRELFDCVIQKFIPGILA
jgi:hypothetical protein